MTDAPSTVPDDTGVFYLNPPGVLSAGQSEQHPEGGVVKEQDLPPSARSDFQENIRTQQSRAEAEERAYMQRRQADAQRLREIEGQRPKIPTEKLVGPAPDAREYQKDSMAFASSMAMLGALMAKGGRMSGSNALAAFGGALKGWQEGNLEAYTNAVDKWKHETERTIENNRQLMQKYQLVMDNYRLNIDQQRANMEEIAIEHHDQMAYNVLKTGNMVAMAQLQDMRREWTDGSRGAEETYKKMLANYNIQDLEMRKTAQQYLPIIGQIDSFVHPDGTPWTEGEKMSTRNLVNHYFPPPKGAGIGGVSGVRMSPRNEFIANYMDTHNGQRPSEDEITRWERDRNRELSYGRSSGTTSVRIENAVNEVEQLIPQAVEASRNYPRGDSVQWNKIRNAIRGSISDTELNDFEFANFSLITAYTRAMNPQGIPRVNDRLEQHAAGILSDYVGSKAYETQVRRLWKEVQASKIATQETAQGSKPGSINAPVPGLDKPAGGGAPVRVQTPAEAQGLPVGTPYITPDGRVFTR